MFLFGIPLIVLSTLLSKKAVAISFYSPQMVATVNTTKYTIENDLTIKRKKEKKKKKKKQTYIQRNGMYLSKGE